MTDRGSDAPVVPGRAPPRYPASPVQRTTRPSRAGRPARGGSRTRGCARAACRPARRREGLAQFPDRTRPGPWPLRRGQLGQRLRSGPSTRARTEAGRGKARWRRRGGERAHGASGQHGQRGFHPRQGLAPGRTVRPARTFENRNSRGPVLTPRRDRGACTEPKAAAAESCTLRTCTPRPWNPGPLENPGTSEPLEPWNLRCTRETLLS